MNPAIRHVLSRKPRCTQVEAFVEIADQLTDREYWRLAQHIFSRHLSPITPVYQYGALWHKIFTSPRAYRSHFAPLQADSQKWEQMPAEITCYRGCGPHNGDGVFYSLNRYTAEMFGHLHDPDGRIITLRCRKSDCIFRGGRQAEIIAVPMLRLARPDDCLTIPEIQEKVNALAQKIADLTTA